MLNGTRAVLTAVDPSHRTLSLRTDDHQQVTVPAGWAAGHLDHGYAMTCHTAQGATVETALVYGAGGLTREAGYVALSRGRTANHLYVSDHADERGVDMGDGHLDQLAARLANRRTQTLATRQLTRDRDTGWRQPRTQDVNQARVEGISR